MIQIAEPSIGLEEWEAIRAPLESGWLTQGPIVGKFEKDFARLHGAKHALAVTSCTTGLHLALAAREIGPGDEVIVPAFTWVATANCVLYCGATPVFADVDRVTFDIDLVDLKRKLSPRTKAVIPVHLFGYPAEMDAIREIVGSKVFVLEDAACAAGAKYKGRSVGTLGDAAAFSFHPRKSVTTGEGGIVTTANDALAERMGFLRNHGASVSEEMRHLGPKPYLLPDFDHLGFNYRMTDLQAAVGLVQLKKLERFVEERAKRAAWYREQLRDVRWLRTPTEPSDGKHAWQAFVTFVDRERAPAPRNDLMEKLFAQGVSTRPGTHAAHSLGLYRKRGVKPSDCPVALECAEQTIALPLHNKMSDEDYAWVVTQVKALGG
jgi:dTDP-4-amino-4,6-dideoxygalactose transaminase